MQQGDALIGIADARLRRRITRAAQQAQLSAVTASSAMDTVRECGDMRPTVIVADLGPVEMSGADLCRQLRQHTYAPIIMVANGEEDVERVIALEVGADTVVDMDVGSEVLAALVRSAVRRAQPASVASDGDEVTVGPLTVDRSSRSARVDGCPIELSVKEYALLEALVQRRGHVLTKDYLLERVWETPPSSRDRALAIYMTRLRRKIGDDARAEALIQTVHGIGYTLRAPHPAASAA
ncbi:MAG: response regulator transcription factor [Armatimonadota bacterium]